MTHTLKAVVCGVFAPLLIFAAQQNPPQQQSAPQNRMMMMTQRMDTTLQSCQQAQTALTQGLQLVDQARSNPGSYTQSSLADASRKLTQAQSELNRCTSSLAAMRQMHEKMRAQMQQRGGMMGSGAAGAPQAPPK